MLEFEKEYWNHRYKNGLNSGDGSYNKEEIATRFKALEELKDIKSILDVGCGDISQIDRVLTVFKETEYIGIDSSELIIRRNSERKLDRCVFQKIDSNFFYYPSDLVICFDVLYHIIEDEDYRLMLESLKQSAQKYLYIIDFNSYGMSIQCEVAKHIKRRRLDLLFFMDKFTKCESVIIPSERGKSLFKFSL